MSELDDHSHCQSCIRIKCTSDKGCAIVTCQHHCGAIFHWCKSADHEYFCLNAHVPCINQLYGCPLELRRGDLKTHLAVCPASVVSCTFEWNRWPLYAKERNAVVPGKRSNGHARSGQLDVALALKDQKMLNNARKLPIGLQRTLKSKLCPRFPTVPLLPTEGNSLDDLAAETEKISFNEIPSTQQKTSQSQQCDSATVPTAPPLPTKETISLDLTVESVTKYQAKPDSMYTFQCQQAFQRSEYPWHVKNVHSEIFMNLNGWQQARCPLATYGCDFLINRMCPNTEGSRVVYSSVLESFGVQPHISEALRQPSSDANSSRSIQLLDLPFEVLETIAENLDGFSLNNLALTCGLLQEVCYNLLQKKGIVVLQWQKDSSKGDRPKWNIGGEMWMFSNSITPISTWVPAEEQFSMTDHLLKCPHYEREPPKGDRVQVIQIWPSDSLKEDGGCKDRDDGQGKSGEALLDKNGEEKHADTIISCDRTPEVNDSANHDLERTDTSDDWASDCDLVDFS